MQILVSCIDTYPYYIHLHRFVNTSILFSIVFDPELDRMGQGGGLL